MLNVLTVPADFDFKHSTEGECPVVNLANLIRLIDENYDCSFNALSEQELINGEIVTRYVIDCIRSDIETTFTQYHISVRSSLISSALTCVCREHAFVPDKQTESTPNKNIAAMSDLETFLRMPRPADWDYSDKAVKHAQYVEYLKNPDDSNPLVEGISTNEIWCEMMGNYDQELDLKIARTIAKELKALGYDNGSQRTLPGYGRVRLFTLN